MKRKIETERQREKERRKEGWEERREEEIPRQDENLGGNKGKVVEK